jgi:uncharacterized membrane protein
MLKPVFGVAAAGILGVVIWKILLLPLVAGLMGVLFTILKFAVLAAVVLFVVWLLRRSNGGEARDS